VWRALPLCHLKRTCSPSSVVFTLELLSDIWFRNLRYIIVILLILRRDNYMIGTLFVFGRSLVWFSVMRPATCLEWGTTPVAYSYSFVHFHGYVIKHVKTNDSELNYKSIPRISFLHERSL
jgi:hypothetical protein